MKRLICGVLSAVMALSVALPVFAETENPIPATAVKLDKTSVTFSGPDEMATLKATVMPSNADETEVLWKSSNPNVADLWEDGNECDIYAEKPGTAVVTAYIGERPGIKATCRVTVK